MPPWCATAAWSSGCGPTTHTACLASVASCPAAWSGLGGRLVTFDLVIRGGTVLDGSGRPRFRADVGVTDGRITALGRLRERGSTEIDAEGRMVAPGFIDGHTHMDAQPFWNPLGTRSSWHGVTAVVRGNCGLPMAPCSADEQARALRHPA